MTANTEIAILDRAMRPDREELAPGVARCLLSFAFPAADHERMNALAAKAQNGTLTPDEQTELEEYCRAGDLLALLHSKARMALKGTDREP